MSLVSVSGMPLRGESGEVIKWYGTNADIEDRKTAEEAVYWNEQNRRTVLDSIPVLICTKNESGEVEGANQQLLNYTGKTLEELKDWPNLVHPDDRDAAENQWGHSLRTGQPRECEVRLLGADGQYRWFHVRDVLLRNGQGNVAQWYSLFIDVEDLKVKEASLRANENRLHHIIESVPGMIACANAEGMNNYANKRAMDYVGMQLAEVAGERWLETIHPDERDHVRSEWADVTRRAKPWILIIAGGAAGLHHKSLSCICSDIFLTFGSVAGSWLVQVEPNFRHSALEMGCESA